VFWAFGILFSCFILDSLRLLLLVAMSRPNCRFGWQCHRPDCFYHHPDGRAIDGNPDPRITLGPMFFAPPMAQNGRMVPMMPLPMHPAMPFAQSMPQQHSGGSPAQSPTNVRKGAPECRFGRKCTRANCYFTHPDGREIEDRDANGNDEKEDADEYEVLRALDEEDNMHDQEAVDEDSWFPTSGTCSCCKGFIYRCPCPDAFCSRCDAAAAVAAHEEQESNSGSPHQVNGDADWAPWKDEWFAESRNCSTCHGYRYRVVGQPVCNACQAQ